ncbi:MAG: hypothetical protein QG602_3566 [Verrucomicrobiota bacterium]|nr:hypothetical protein [Verrucomicrobiota bacterium]
MMTVLVTAVVLGYAAFTQHAWEDYYITLRSSRNMVEGHGLVFQPGERVHTFTSPLGVLVPAACTWLAGPGNEESALWLFRLLNAAALVAAAIWAWRRFDTLGTGWLGRLVFYGLAFADAKLVGFSMNGMETAMLVAFVVWLWSELEQLPGPRPWAVAAGCGGLMWTRPDAFILGAALIIPHLFFRKKSGGSGALPWRALSGGVLLGGLIYLPWFAWAWWYYGSPVPHTIIAKGQVTPPLDVASVLLIPWRSMTGDSLLRDIFLPTYWHHGGWPAWLPGWAYVLSLLASLGWIWPGLAAPFRRVSLALFIGSFYFCAIILFPWYSPPWTVLAALALAGMVDELAGKDAGRLRAGIARSLGVLTVAVQVFVLVLSAWEMRSQQRIIEQGMRREIGLWLRQQAAPGDTVFMECLGYIGYFSGLKTYDYPGLSSPEVVAAIRGGAHRFTEVIDRTKPDWLVLRPFEIADAAKPENAAWRHYELVRAWDKRGELDAVTVLPGRGWVDRDAQFLVFRRRP